MRTAVATDTNSGILGDENQDIYVLPMPVIIEGKTYFEGIDICNGELYEAMRQHKELSTSQPSPGQLMDFWDGILKEGYDEIVYIPMSSGLSGSCHSAIQISEDYDGKVCVVDNHRLSITQKESVFAALQFAREGQSAKEIRERLEKSAYDASIYVTVDSLEYLKKGGRITPAVAMFASILNIKPVLTIQGDKLDVHSKARGIKQAQIAMLKAIKQDRDMRFAGVSDGELQIDTAGTLESEEQAERWQKMAQEEFPGVTVSYYHLPCSLACHVGMNAMGIGIVKKEVNI